MAELITDRSCSPVAVQETCCDAVSDKAACCGAAADRRRPAAAPPAAPQPRHPRARARALRRRRDPIAGGPAVDPTAEPARRAAARLPRQLVVLRTGRASTDEAGTRSSAARSTPTPRARTERRVQASLGCGVPTAVADLHDGDAVLDLGSGAGADVLISARRVAPTGRAIGIDMTDEMLDLARTNAAAAGVDNVEFLKGYLEELPLPDASVDVIISNCVINLSGDKPRVLREAARVLRPGGRFAISDVIADPDMDDATRADMAAMDRLHRRRPHARRIRARAHRSRTRRRRDPRDPPRPRARRRGDRPRPQALNARGGKATSVGPHPARRDHITTRDIPGATSVRQQLPAPHASTPAHPSRNPPRDGRMSRPGRSGCIWRG